MQYQLKSITLILLVSIFALMSQGIFASDSKPTEQTAGNENTITEGYTHPSEFKARNTGQAITLTSRHYGPREFDIFYIDAWLFDDRDHDGFYSSFDLIFDLDVNYGRASVFANIWIRPEHGYYELLYSTDIFTIEGYGTHDEYHVSTDLIDDYPVGYYDIMIELYDVDYSLTTPVAIANSYSFDALFALPLESRYHYGNHGSLGVSIHASAGNFWLPLIPLGLLLTLRLRKLTERQ